MGRNRELKKQEFNGFPNCVNDDHSMAGRWHEYFGNENPIILEIGCGKADLGLGLAALRPDVNVIGVDIKARRMWNGATRAIDQGLNNIAFLRCNIHGIGRYFAPGEVSDIWITFPDPYPRKKHAKNRMMGEKFLSQYLGFMKPGGTIWFKTDNEPLFDWALEHFEELNAGDQLRVEVLEHTRDLHNSPLKNEINGLITEFESMFMAEGIPIKYVAFRIKATEAAHV